MRPASTSARVAAIIAGVDVPGVTVNRYCSSSLQTIRMAAHAIKAGEGDVFISGGVETVSRFRVRRGRHAAARTRSSTTARARTKERTEGGQPPWTPPAGLPDVYIAMGQTAENVVEAENVDARRDGRVGRPRRSSARSRRRRTAYFEREITPVTLADGTVVSKDDGPRPGTTVEKLATLQPVFRPDGKVTAGNACPLNDGAAAVVVMSDTKAEQLGVTPLARIVASGVSALNPEIMGLGPIEASRQALKRANLTADDIDLFEINEAFAAQVIPSAKHLGIPYEKLNVHGGAIALGHPFGMTGARIMTTLINGLQTDGARYGLETMCVGGGQGMAMIIERSVTRTRICVRNLHATRMAADVSTAGCRALAADRARGASRVTIGRAAGGMRRRAARDAMMPCSARSSAMPDVVAGVRSAAARASRRCLRPRPPTVPSRSGRRRASWTTKPSDATGTSMRNVFTAMPCGRELVRGRHRQVLQRGLGHAVRHAGPGSS